MLLPTPDPNPDHDEDDNNYDRQNYAERGTAPEGVMAGEGWGGEQHHQGGGKGECHDPGNGKAPAHGVMLLPRQEQNKTRW